MPSETETSQTPLFVEPEKILFVDDDPVNVENFVISFGDEYHVLTASSGEKGLSLFRQHPDTGIIISDQRMEGMTGVEMLAEIYRLQPDTIRIILTGFIDVSDIIDAVNRGHIYQYILKPWDVVQLRLVIEQAVQTWHLTKENRRLTEALWEKNSILEKTNKQLKDSEHRLRSLSSALIDARENEQKRIALELHDELGQSLAALKLQIRAVENRCLGTGSRTERAVAEELTEIRTSINEIIENVRRLSQNLSPVIIDDLGLDAAIEHLINRFAEVYRIGCVFHGPMPGHFLDRQSHLLVYRLLQEALNNCGKHAQAGRVAITSSIGEETYHLCVEDDGCGFDQAQVAKRSGGGFGLSAMAERVEMLAGKMQVASSPGKGTRVEFSFPLHRAGERK